MKKKLTMHLLSWVIITLVGIVSFSSATSDKTVQAPPQIPEVIMNARDTVQPAGDMTDTIPAREESTQAAQDPEESESAFDIQNLPINPWTNQLNAIRNDFRDANRKNPDIVAWMDIPQVSSEPIAYHAEDNLHYLYRDKEGNDDRAGVNYMSTASGGTFEGSTLIYGHNTWDDRRLSGLIQYLDYDFFHNNASVLVYDGTEDVFYYYVPFAVLEIEDGKEYMQLNGFADEKEKQAYHTMLADQSLVEVFEANRRFAAASQVLFLQTCLENLTLRREVLALGLEQTINGAWLP